MMGENVIRLVIELDPASGNINVNGPIDNKMLSYGMLECARDAIRDHIQQQAIRNGLVVARGKLPPTQNGKH